MEAAAGGRQREAERDTDTGVFVGVSDGRRSGVGHVELQDPISPKPEKLALPRLLDGEIRLWGYPLHMILAEKLTACVSLGTFSTRWRDYGDIFVLTRRHEADGDDLETALRVVSAHRGVDLRALSAVLDGYGALGQTPYVKWMRKHQMQDWLPEDFATIVAAVTEFADMPLTGNASGATWSPSRLAWQ